MPGISEPGWPLFFLPPCPPEVLAAESADSNNDPISEAVNVDDVSLIGTSLEAIEEIVDELPIAAAQEAAMKEHPKALLPKDDCDRFDDCSSAIDVADIFARVVVSKEEWVSVCELIWCR